MKAKRISALFLALAAVCLTAVFVLSAVFFVAYDLDFYTGQYKTLNVMADTGMKLEDLEDATEVLLLYCKGERADIVIERPVDGQVRPVFNERETAHMVDVRVLALGAERVRDVLAVTALVLILLGLVMRRSFRALALPLLCGFLIGLLVLGALGAIAATNFDWFWTKFHHVFFTNDLWLLDPFTSLMINMLPQELFSALVMRILFTFALVQGGTMLLCLLLGRRRRKQA